MSKQFRIYGPFWYCTAVNCNVLAMLSGTIIMNYLRKNLLPCSTFACNEYRKISWGNLNSNVNCPVKSLMVANYSKPLFNILQIFHFLFYNPANLRYF